MFCVPRRFFGVGHNAMRCIFRGVCQFARLCDCGKVGRLNKYTHVDRAAQRIPRGARPPEICSRRVIVISRDDIIHVASRNTRRGELFVCRDGAFVNIHTGDFLPDVCFGRKFACAVAVVRELARFSRYVFFRRRIPFCFFRIRHNTMRRIFRGVCQFARLCDCGEFGVVRFFVKLRFYAAGCDGVCAGCRRGCVKRQSVLLCVPRRFFCIRNGAVRTVLDKVSKLVACYVGQIVPRCDTVADF